ncbi:MAG TPA: hypothetical protein VGP30_05600, partial [Candidatus Limnocylindrales bacterium]|nr:hypothetical protein [Candidatus Limnocylindrales bacterium]
GWRAVVSVALAVAIGRPVLWLFGALGFAARGGFVLLALPIITIPSPVILSILLQDQFDATGITISGEVAAMLGGLVLFGIVVPGLLLAAYADVAAFERLVEDPDTEELRAGASAAGIDGPARRRLVVMIAAIQALALVPVALAAALIAGPIYDVALREQLLPSDGATPLVVRIVRGAREPLAFLLVALVIADLVYAIASRTVLTRRSGLVQRDRRERARAVRTFGSAILAWLVTIAIVGPVLWAIVVSWDGVRNVLLSSAGMTDPQALPSTLIATILFAAIWVAGTILTGFASAVRAALWSVEAIR